MKKLTYFWFRKLHLKSSLIALCMAGTLSFSMPAFAETIDSGGSLSLIQAIDSLRQDLVSRMETLKKRLEDLFMNASDSMTVSSQQPNLVVHNATNAFQFTENSTGDSKSALPVYNLVAQAVQKSIAEKLKASLDPGNQDAQRQVLLQPPTSGDNALVDMFSGLLGPLVYSSPTEQNVAERNVAFFSDYATPFGSVDLKQLHEKPELENSRAGQAYRVKIFTQATIRALFLRNLYDSFSMRTAVKDLGKMSGMPNTNDASLAQVLQYVATRRVSDPNWYNTINTAPPIVVTRETAYMMAEIEQLLYQLHMDNERMLQTMTAIGVLNLRANKFIADRDEIELKQAVEGTAPEYPTEGNVNNIDTSQYTPPTTNPNGNSNNGSGIPPAPK